MVVFEFDKLSNNLVTQTLDLDNIEIDHTKKNYRDRRRKIIALRFRTISFHSFISTSQHLTLGFCLPATLDERFIKLRTATNLSMSNPKRLGLALPIWLISINHRRHSVFNLFTFLFVLMNQIIKHLF